MISKELGLNRFVCEQPPYNILDRRIERELVPLALTYGFAIIPWSPLAGGLLTGKYTRGSASPEGSRFAEPSRKAQLKERMPEQVFDVTEGLAPLAKDKGCTMGQLALAWAGHQPGITSAIIGPRTAEHLEENLGALAVTLTDQDKAKIDELVAPGRAVSFFYEADFGPHPFR